MKELKRYGHSEKPNKTKQSFEVNLVPLNVYFNYIKKSNNLRLSWEISVR